MRIARAFSRRLCINLNLLSSYTAVLGPVSLVLCMDPLPESHGLARYKIITSASKVASFASLPKDVLNCTGGHDRYGNPCLFSVLFYLNPLPGKVIWLYDLTYDQESVMSNSYVFFFFLR